MATSNENIQDELTAHRIGTIRFGNNLAARVRRILNRAEPELQAAIRARLERIAHLGFDPGPATTRRMQRMAALIAEINQPTFAEINAATREQLLRFAAGESVFLAGLISDALPVVYDPVLPSPRQLRGIVLARPIENEVLRQWLQRYRVNDQTRIMDEIRQGLLFGETPTQIGRRIFGTRALNGTDGARETTRRGAQVLAQTAVSAIQNGVYTEIAKMNKRVIPREVFVATLDSRTTPICRSLDGNVYPAGEGDIPPLHINCRSIRAPVVDGRRLGNRPAVEATERNLRGLRGAARRRAVDRLVGRVPAETTYQEWLAGRSAAFQDEVLGPTRGRLFRAGEIDLAGFVNDQGKQLTLRQLYDRNPGAFQRTNIPAPTMD